MDQSPNWCIQSKCQGPISLYDNNCIEDQFLSPDTGKFLELTSFDGNELVNNKSIYSGEYSEEEVITQCIEEELEEREMTEEIENIKIMSSSSCPKKVFNLKIFD